MLCRMKVIPAFLIVVICCASGESAHAQTAQSHYHIQWTPDATLDWKAFPTKEEATRVAHRIKQPCETFTIVERDDECERCKEFRLRTFFAVNE